MTANRFSLTLWPALALFGMGQCGRVVAQQTRLQSDIWPQPAIQPIGAQQDWLNTDGKPVAIRKGQVYLIDFWEYTCVNCLRTLPYLKEWNKRYAADGLTIIGIHTPEFGFAKSKANVAAAVKRLGITWPVLLDSSYRNWIAYGNNFWPREYFVDANMRIVADHSGEGNYDETEARIQRLLLQLHPGLKFPKVMSPVRSSDVPGAVCYPTTAEMYVGARGAAQGQHGNISPFVPGHTFLFLDSGMHSDGKVYADGLWTTERESLRHARLTSHLDDYVAIRYHALECNAVIRPEGDTPFKVYVQQDGAWVRKADRGADLQYDKSGRSYLYIDSPRMYAVIKNAAFGSHELKLASNSPDFGLYSFTFGSCEAN